MAPIVCFDLSGGDRELGIPVAGGRVHGHEPDFDGLALIHPALPEVTVGKVDSGRDLAEQLPSRDQVPIVRLEQQELVLRKLGEEQLVLLDVEVSQGITELGSQIGGRAVLRSLLNLRVGHRDAPPIKLLEYEDLIHDLVERRILDLGVLLGRDGLILRPLDLVV